MSIHVMSLVLRADRIVKDRTQTLVLLVLGDYANDDGICWPSIATLARKARMSVRGIQYALAELRRDGFIEVDTGKGGRATTNLYRISLQRLQGLTPKPAGTEDLKLELETLQIVQGGVQIDAQTLQNRTRNPATAVAPDPSVDPSIEPPEERGAMEAAARSANAREIRRTIPKPLVTGDFVVAWERWVIHWSLTFNQGKAIPFATADNHLKIFREMGATRAIAAIENSISRRLREPGEPFKNNGNHRTTNGRSFEHMPDYSGVTDK